jgi:hypothetical protein
MIENPPSNFPWDIKKSTTSKSYTPVNTTQSPKRAADWSAVKIGDYFSKTQKALASTARYETLLCPCKI